MPAANGKSLWIKINKQGEEYAKTKYTQTQLTKICISLQKVGIQWKR
jgi:hypothetical protein